MTNDEKSGVGKRYIQRPFDVARVTRAVLTVRDVKLDGPIVRCVEITIDDGECSMDAALTSKGARMVAETILAMCDAIDAGEQ